jgi:hypothetical protein
VRKNRSIAVPTDIFLHTAQRRGYVDVTTVFGAAHGVMDFPAVDGGASVAARLSVYRCRYAGGTVTCDTANGPLAFSSSSATGRHIISIVDSYIADMVGEIETYTEPKREGRPSLLSAYRRAFAIWL